MGGVTLAVPLPRLAGMLSDNGDALADGSELPPRFGVWFFGNGIIPDRWVPKQTGSGDEWELSEQLAPLQGVKPWLSVLTGLNIKIPNVEAHASMPGAALTGAPINRVDPVLLPSIDQLIAPLTGAGTAFPSGIHVGVSSRTGATRLGLNISFRGPGAPNPPEYSPSTLFQQLLSFTSDGAPTQGPDPTLLRRNVVLDAVKEDAASLRKRLGVEDQLRLDEHLEGINQLQGQIAQQAEPRITAPLADPDDLYPDRGRDGSISRQRGQAFSDLLVFAMATDLTRVFSYIFTCPASHGDYGDAGLAPSTFHEDYGHRLSPLGVSEATKGFNIGVRYAMSNLADTLARMRDTPDGAGNLLDNSGIYVTSCVSESQTHGGTDYPLLVAGKAGGKLKGDQHVRLLDENVSKVPFTLLKAFGGDQDSFGLDEGRVTDVLPELLA